MRLIQRGPHGGPRDFGGKLSRGQISERAVRPELVVIVPEDFDQFPGVVKVEEPVFVEAFVTEFAVEAFDVAVLRRFAWRDKAVGDLPLVVSTLARN